MKVSYFSANQRQVRTMHDFTFTCLAEKIGLIELVLVNLLATTNADSEKRGVFIQRNVF